MSVSGRESITGRKPGTIGSGTFDSLDEYAEYRPGRRGSQCIGGFRALFLNRPNLLLILINQDIDILILLK